MTFTDIAPKVFRHCVGRDIDVLTTRSGHCHQERWFLWTGGDIDKVPKYDAETDSSASGWYNAANVFNVYGEEVIVDYTPPASNSLFFGMNI